MSGIDPGFFIIANLLVFSLLIIGIRAVFPYAWVLRTVLTIIGFYLTYLVSPRFLLFFILYWSAVWLIQWPTQKIDGIKSKWLNRFFTTLSILLPLSPLLIWKLIPKDFTLAINEAFAKLLWYLFPGLGFADAIVTIAVPVGLSFAVFRALDLIIKIRLGFIKPISFDRVLYYGFFPSVLAVGPIIEYEEVQIDGKLDRFPKSGDVAVGSVRILLGATKVFFFSVLLNHYAQTLWEYDETSTLAAWGAVFTYGIYFYVNFSGYSDLSIGSARILGFRLKENFNNPYFKTNPSAFWSGWHMSLTRWVYRYVFTPLGGMRPNRQYFAIFMTIMVIALWHNITLPLIIYGTYHGLVMVGHRYADNRRRKAKRKLSKNPVILALKMLAVFAFTTVSYPLMALKLEEIIPFYLHLIPGI